jgi:hypothetical protein
VILSDGLWRRRFGADAAIVGQPVLIDGTQWQVVGVMPASFTFPQLAEIWAPWSADEKTARNRTAHYLTIFGRLASGRSLEEARAQMATITRRLATDHPDTNSDLTSDVLTLSRGMADTGVPQVLGLWQAAGLFVLLIACANIANLLLARAADRGREIAIRLALGSSRGRIVRRIAGRERDPRVAWPPARAGDGRGRLARHAGRDARPHRPVRRRMGSAGPRRVDDRRHDRLRGSGRRHLRHRCLRYRWRAASSPTR